MPLPTITPVDWALNTKKTVITTLAVPKGLFRVTLPAGSSRLTITATSTVITHPRFALLKPDGSVSGIAATSSGNSTVWTYSGGDLSPQQSDSYILLGSEAQQGAVVLQVEAVTPSVAVPVIVDLDVVSSTPNTPDPTVEAEKLAIADLKARAKSGAALVDDDVLTIILVSTALAVSVVNALDAGGGYKELRLLGVSDGDAIKAMAIYNLKLDSRKYESERAIDYISEDVSRLAVFFSYLAVHNIQKPDISPMWSAFRSSVPVYNALREWHSSVTA